MLLYSPGRIIWKGFPGPGRGGLSFTLSVPLSLCFCLSVSMCTSLCLSLSASVSMNLSPIPSVAVQFRAWGLLMFSSLALGAV